MSGERGPKGSPLWIVGMVLGVLLVISESVLVAVKPASSPLIVQDATVLAGLGVSTFATLRSMLGVKAAAHEARGEAQRATRESERNAEQLQVISANVNGNLSRLIDFARERGYPPEALKEIDLKRQELEWHIERRKNPSKYE